MTMTMITNNPTTSTLSLSMKKTIIPVPVPAPALVPIPMPLQGPKGSLSHSSKLRTQRSDSFSGPDLKLFVKDVSDPHSKKRPITVKTWSTVKDVKDVVQKLLNIPPSLQRLYYGPFMNSGVSLPNHRSLGDAGIYKNGQVLYLEIKGLPSGSSSSSSSNTSGSGTRLMSTKKTSTFDLSTLKHAGNDICISKAFFDKTPKIYKSIIKQSRIALAYGIKPVLVLDGSGGTYFLHDINKRKIAVFKPADEEPYSINNPRGYVKSGTTGISSGGSSSAYGYGDGNDYANTVDVSEEDNMSMRAGIKPGEACLREVAAYLLDEKGFSGVPMTTLVEARHPAFHYNGSMLKLNQGGAAIGSHSFIPSASMSMSMASTSFSNTTGTGLSTSSFTSSSASALASPSTSTTNISSPRRKKVGSCQEFMPSECSMDDLSPSKISKEEVHKIAILDIRILNADRNTANLLCRRKPEQPDTFELIPIDHGYCLRTVADVCWFDWCWLDWPQLKEPLSDEMKEYVLNLDIEKDIQMLRDRLDIPNVALDYFRASSQLLQKGVQAGLTLYDIAILCCRNDDAGERPSKLETIVSMAGDIASSAVDNGRWHHAAASRALEQQLSPDNNGYLSRRITTSSKGMNGGTDRRNSHSMNIFKSASSVNFSSFTSSSSTTPADDLSNSVIHESGLNSSSSMENNNNHQLDLIPPAPMAQSSGSDSSSNGAVEEKEEEEEECEKWAADFIAGTLDYATTPMSAHNTTRRQRSISFANSDSSDESSNSDDSSQLSKSPVGFWFVPPSASKARSSLDDDTTWSPDVSPNTSQRNIHIDTLDLRRERAVKFDSALPPPMLNAKLSSLSLGESQHQNAIDDGENDEVKNLLSMRDTPDSPLAPPTMMTRSQSYSAFSFKRINNSSLCQPSAARASPTTIPSDEYEKYYQKFINLLIDRETAPMINKGQS